MLAFSSNPIPQGTSCPSGGWCLWFSSIPFLSPLCLPCDKYNHMNCIWTFPSLLPLLLLVLFLLSGKVKIYMLIWWIHLSLHPRRGLSKQTPRNKAELRLSMSMVTVWQYAAPTLMIVSKCSQMIERTVQINISCTQGSSIFNTHIVKHIKSIKSIIIFISESIS